VWGAAEVVGAARGAAKVGEISDEGAAQVLAVGPPEVAVGPLASVRRGGEGGLTSWARGLTACCGQRWKAR
jgi:hypothetical protein